jgi:hypothetical protein
VTNLLSTTVTFYDQNVPRRQAPALKFFRCNFKVARVASQNLVPLHMRDGKIANRIRPRGSMRAFLDSAANLGDCFNRMPIRKLTEKSVGDCSC